MKTSHVLSLAILLGSTSSFANPVKEKVWVVFNRPFPEGNQLFYNFERTLKCGINIESGITTVSPFTAMSTSTEEVHEFGVLKTDKILIDETEQEEKLKKEISRQVNEQYDLNIKLIEQQIEGLDPNSKTDNQIFASLSEQKKLLERQKVSQSEKNITDAIAYQRDHLISTGSFLKASSIEIASPTEFSIRCESVGTFLNPTYTVADIKEFLRQGSGIDIKIAPRPVRSAEEEEAVKAQLEQLDKWVAADNQVLKDAEAKKKPVKKVRPVVDSTLQQKLKKIEKIKDYTPQVF